MVDAIENTRVFSYPYSVALRIQSRTWKNQDGSLSSSWRLIVEDWTSGKRVCLYPARTEYGRYGLDPKDTLEEAQRKLKVARANERMKNELERRARIEARLKKEDLKESAHLPAWLYSKYLAWLIERRMWVRVPAKTESHLRCMRKLILSLDLPPWEWPASPEKIYRYFRSKRLSLSYIEKVMPLLNDYGYFYCKEMGKPFLKIPPPSGTISRRIDDANQEHRNGLQSESKPIYPYHLEELPLPDLQLRWLKFTVYFGLRPSEVDTLTERNKGKTWDLSRDSRGTWILHVFQSKLVRIARQRRWKRIPCILVEQKKLVGELGSEMKRPYPKQIQKYLGPGYGLYGGRKAFEKLMREHGQSFLNISRWLGHQDIKRTEQNYRDVEAVEYDRIKR